MPLDDDLSRQELADIVAALLRLDDFMGSIDDLPRLLDLIVSEAETLLDAEGASLLLYDPQGGDLFFEVVRGAASANVRGRRVPSGEGICGWVARERRSLRVPEAGQDPRHYGGIDQAAAFTTHSIVAAPMVRKGELVGVLEVVNKSEGRPFSRHDQRLLEAVAGLAAVAIENARLYEDAVRRARLAAVGQAMAGLAHYIKNILTGLSSSSAVIDHALQAGDLNTLRRAWRTMKASTDKVGALVVDMLSYSASRTLKPEPVELGSLVGDVVQAQMDRAERLGVALEYTPPGRPLRVSLDPTPFERCVWNLVVNALDALEERSHGEEVAPAGHVEVQLGGNESGAVILEVRDNGPGIPAEVGPRIWELFFSTKGSRGSGIGLALTQKLMRDLGGEACLLRTGPEGTVFQLRLPAGVETDRQQEEEERR